MLYFSPQNLFIYNWKFISFDQHLFISLNPHHSILSFYDFGCLDYTNAWEHRVHVLLCLTYFP